MLIVVVAQGYTVAGAPGNLFTAGERAVGNLHRSFTARGPDVRCPTGGRRRRECRPVRPFLVYLSLTGTGARSRNEEWNVSTHDHDDALLTPAEVATLFRVDPKTVTRWAQAGRLSAVRTLGGHRRYRRAEVLAMLARELPDAAGPFRFRTAAGAG